MKKKYLILFLIVAVQWSFALPKRHIQDPPNVAFSYSQGTYCPNSMPAFPVFSDANPPAGIFSASPLGLVINATTGGIDFQSSMLGSYIVTYTVMATAEEPSYTATTVVTIAQPDNSVLVDGNTLTAVQTGTNILYQWYMCGSVSNVIPGATTQSFTIDQSGSFKVVISLNDCEVESACYAFDDLGISGANAPIFKIYPNPASSDITVVTNTKVDNLTLTDINGRIVLEGSTENLNISALENGIYLLRIVSGTAIFTKKIIKQ